MSKAWPVVLDHQMLPFQIDFNFEIVSLKLRVIDDAISLSHSVRFQRQVLILLNLELYHFNNQLNRAFDLLRQFIQEFEIYFRGFWFHYYSGWLVQNCQSALVFYVYCLRLRFRIQFISLS